ncbi:unnamed protein product, partial [Didymodactylos carnosus]
VAIDNVVQFRKLVESNKKTELPPSESRDDELTENDTATITTK